MTNESPVIAAFDFDGTITTRDTLLPFLLFTTGYWKSFWKFIKLGSCIISYLAGYTPRQETKERVLTEFFKHTHLYKLEQLGASFAVSYQLKRMIKPEAQKKLDWHRKQNHRCILISASIDTYLIPWYKQAGFSDLICSRLDTTPSDMVTGSLKGLNCWGPEKTRRLNELLAKENHYTLYAYGDSRGDRELLAAADFAFYRSF